MSLLLHVLCVYVCVYACTCISGLIYVTIHTYGCQRITYRSQFPPSTVWVLKTFLLTHPEEETKRQKLTDKIPLCTETCPELLVQNAEYNFHASEWQVRVQVNEG